MKKNNFFVSLPVKAAAVILLFITAFAGVIGSVAIAYMADEGYYTGDFSPVYYPEVDLKYKYAVENFMYNNKINMIIWTVVSLLAAIMLFIYLIYAAGRKRGAEDIELNGIDRIPLDVYIVLLLLLSFVSVSFADSVSYGITATVQIIVFMLFTVIIYVLLISFFMTVAVRIKTGTIFRNTLVFVVLKYVIKGLEYLAISIVWIIRGLPLIWKSIIGFVLYMILNMFMNFALFRGDGTGAFLWLVFHAALFFFMCAVTLQLYTLKKGGEKLAAGNLSYKIPISKLLWDFRSHAQNLNDVGEGMQRAVDERMKSERFKTELITNVSHDIKTPLTSIINYVDLLKKEDLQNDTAAGYIEVLERQSARLKKLTEDLISASKASSGNIAVNTERTDVAELLSQCAAEYTERFAAADLKPVLSLPDEPLLIEADGKLLWRVLDNLLSNICKFSMAGTRVYFSAEKNENKVRVVLRNISAEPLNLTPEELMERFVRGDLSRNTEGSGLGLSIARSLTELQKGTLSIETDGDLFKVILEMPCCE